METAETVVIERKESVSAEESIHWKQLWSLAALYASIIIGWIAYQNYQPKLLVRFHFTDFTFLLAAAQAVIVVAAPLIAGKLGDRYRVHQGHRLPIISSGISFAAMIFMAVAFTLLSNPGEFFKWILPLLIVCWLVAMSVFTSPALSTIELFTPIDKLPRSMAVLTITGNLVYAVEPIIVDIIDFIGAPLTFMLGGVVVFLSGYALKKHSLTLFKKYGNKERIEAETGNEKSPHGFIFFMGVSVGLATTLLFYIFPIVLKDQMHPYFNDGTFMVAAVLLVSALFSWPASNFVNRIGIERCFWLSLASVVIFSTAILFVSSRASSFLLLIAFALTYTSLSVSALPLAIKRSTFSEKVFCVGIFFSGVALPESVWEAWLAWLP